MVPFAQTTPAATTGGMLSKEDGMTTHGCLLAIVGDDGRRQALGYEVHGMTADGWKTFVDDIGTVLCGEVETAAESGLGQSVEEVGEVIAFFRGTGLILCLSFFGDGGIVITEEVELYRFITFCSANHSFLLILWNFSCNAATC